MGARRRLQRTCRRPRCPSSRGLWHLTAARTQLPIPTHCGQHSYDAHAPRAWGHEARARRARRLKEKDNLRRGPGMGLGCEPRGAPAAQAEGEGQPAPRAWVGLGCEPRGAPRAQAEGEGQPARAAGGRRGARHPLPRLLRRPGARQGAAEGCPNPSPNPCQGAAPGRQGRAQRGPARTCECWCSRGAAEPRLSARCWTATEIASSRALRARGASAASSDIAIDAMVYKSLQCIAASAA